MDINDIINFIHSDKGLSLSQKEEMLSEEGKKKLAVVLGGSAGAALGVALAKYRKMSTTSQVLLSALGFGIGVLLYKYYTRERFANYNSDTKMYEIDK
jgi:hypothetical protein